VICSAGAVLPSESGYGGRVEVIENMQMTVSRGTSVVLKFTKGTIGHLSKRAFKIELDDDHEACQLLKIIFPDFSPCEFENKRHDQTDLVVSSETNITKVLDPAMSRPLSKYPASVGAGYHSNVLLQAGAQADQQSPEHNHFKPQRYLPETRVLPIKQIASSERPRDEILLQTSPKVFISYDNSIMKQLDTTQKEQEGKHTNLVDSHDNFITSEPNPTLYNPKILASMGTGHSSDVLLQDQEPPGHDHSKSFNSRNPTLPTMQMTRLYVDAADEILRLAELDLTKHEIGHALRDVLNSKERAGYPDEILLQAAQADDSSGGYDDGNGSRNDGSSGDSAGGGGGSGDDGGDDDVLPPATDASSFAVLPSVDEANSPANLWVVNTTALAVRRRLTTVSNWGEMKSACGSSGTVTLSNGFVMGTYTSQIDFSGKQLVIIGNDKMLDAGTNGRFFSGSGTTSSLEIRNTKMKNAKADVSSLRPSEPA
jgi:hypothetical protein